MDREIKIKATQEIDSEGKLIEATTEYKIYKNDWLLCTLTGAEIAELKARIAEIK